MVRRGNLQGALSFLVLFSISNAAARTASPKADDWPSLRPAELTDRGGAESQGEHAILLYREDRTDDAARVETHHYRIKILTEEGRKYATIEIPHAKRYLRVQAIRARTIHPDGSATPFTGEIFDKLVVKAKRVLVQVKTFTLPDVQPGTIIEYRYRATWDESRFNPPEWELQNELFTRRARFSFRPAAYVKVFWSASRVPGGKKPKEQVDGDFQLELENVPAFQSEKFMPPENFVRPRVIFFYRSLLDAQDSEASFWPKIGKEWTEATEKFLSKHKFIDQAEHESTSGGDRAEDKLRKLYARAQQLRNLAFRHAHADDPREKSKGAKYVDEVLLRGSGVELEITLVFVALARAAGFEAAVVRVPPRDKFFFSPKLLLDSQLRGAIAEVRLGERTLYLDPATPSCPFGLLSWEKTGVQGMRLAARGDLFVTTPVIESHAARIHRSATVLLDSSGTVSGTVEVSWDGQEALQLRLETLDSDDAARRTDMESRLKQLLPADATLTVDRITGWDQFENPVKVAFQFQAPHFGATTGRRWLLPLSVFQANAKHPFQHANRANPVYLPYTYQVTDEVEVSVPDGYEVESLPTPRASVSAIGRFETSYERQVSGTGTLKLVLTRQLTMNEALVPVEQYGALRSFFDAIQAGDQENVIIAIMQSGARH